METFRILREQWIWAKYQREEFIFPEKQRYTRGTMVEITALSFSHCFWLNNNEIRLHHNAFQEGFLFKRSKIDDSCKQRRFVLCERENTLKYYVNNVS